MANILSALTYTLIDQAGNPRTEAWFTCEFGEAYAVGGVGFDLSPYLKRIEHAQTEWISGGNTRAPASGYGVLSGLTVHSGSMVKAVPVFGDYAAGVSSARFMLHGSYTQDFISGIANLSKLEEIGSGALAAAISGVRFLARVLGY